VVDRVAAQGDLLEAAARRCARAIAVGRLVHVFGSGHSRMAVEELWPRYGSYPGFHPIVELSLTNHHQVVGANGQRQAMFLEGVPGLGRVILRNFALDPRDVMLVFSASGTTVVAVEVAECARSQGLFTIGVASCAHLERVRAAHPDVRGLDRVVDLLLDNGAPAGDAAVSVPGLEGPVGPLSTVGCAVLANALKCRIAELLAAEGHRLPVLTSAVLVGEEASRRLFDAAYDEHRRRVRQL
jgi:uncharacterized phosphosugar-binding protein